MFLENTKFLQNLHHNYAKSSRRSIVWWTLYHGDRSLAILLGLPYGISDKHFTVTITQDPAQVGHASKPFAIQLGMLIGRVIDQVQNRNGPKLSEVMDVEDELLSLAATKSPTWWDFAIPLVADIAVMTDLRERLLCQSQYFLTTMYLHLPYLLKSTSSHLYQGSKETAMDAARQLTLRYRALRSSVAGNPIFDCQSLDFIGFMGAVVLLVGTFHGSGTIPLEDSELIDKTVHVLKQMAATNGNQVASQCGKTLEALLDLCTGGKTRDSPRPKSIRIPYFGVLHVSYTTEFEEGRVPTEKKNQPSPALVYSQLEAGDQQNAHSEPTETPPTIGYEGPYNFDMDIDWTQRDLNDMADDLNFLPNLDLDWEAFMTSDLQ